MKPAVAALVVGLVTFLACYYLLGGLRPESSTDKNASSSSSFSPSLHSTAHQSTQIIDKKTVSSDSAPYVMDDINVSPTTPSTTVEATPSSSTSSTTVATTAATTPFTESREEMLEKLRIKLQPRELFDVDGQIVPHSFLHLHHMKTAGTSMDGLIRCAMKRLRNELGFKLASYSIHECTPPSYLNCLAGRDSRCRQKMKDAAFLSYCAPLKDLPTFEWEMKEDNPIHALTVLRHPVNRVWSMYRFKTRECYRCQTLKEVYERYDSMPPSTGIDNCRSQLSDHQTRNMLTSVNVTDDAKVDQAIADMQKFFTFVGITEDIPSTAAIAGKVFPWLAEHMNDTQKTCRFPHKNSSPQNNRCGQIGTHWDLPEHPDEETAKLIIEHNQLDMKVYEAALQLFELQKEALGLV